MNFREALISLVLSVFKPTPKETIVQWVPAQQIIINGKENSTYQGEILDPARTPCISSLILGFLHPDEPNRELHLAKSAQSGASVNAILGSAWNLQHEGGNILYVINTNAQLKDLSTERIDPLLRSIPHTSAEMENTDSRQRTLTKTFSNGTLYLGSAGTINNLTGKPIRIGINDEGERSSFLNETTVTDLLRVRLTAADGSKLLNFTTLEEEAEFHQDEASGHWEWVKNPLSQVHHEYLKGTQEKCHVPCPYCGTYQELTWEKLQFSHCKEQPALNIPGAKAIWNHKRLATECYILCDSDHCRNQGPENTTPTASGAPWNWGKITQNHKKWMIHLDRLRWVPTPDPERERADIYPQALPGVRSAQYTCLYDIAFAKIQWGNLVQEWITAQGDMTKLRAFINNRLGRPMQRQRTNKLTDTQLARHISTDETYTRLHLDDTTRRHRHTQLHLKAEEIHSLNLIVDVQQNFFKWTLVAYHTQTPTHREGEIAFLDWGMIPYDTDRQWARALDELTDTQFITADGHIGTIARDLPAQNAIDARYTTTEILNFCFQRGGNWIPIWGEGHTARTQNHGKPWWLVDTPIQDNRRNGITQKIPSAGKNIHVLWLDVNHWERELMHHRLGQHDFHNPDNSPRIHLPSDAQRYPGYLAELMNAQESYIGEKGRIKQLRWVKVNPHAPDDYHDTAKWAPLLWDYWHT